MILIDAFLLAGCHCPIPFRQEHNSFTENGNLGVFVLSLLNHGKRRDTERENGSIAIGTDDQGEVFREDWFQTSLSALSALNPCGGRIQIGVSSVFSAKIRHKADLAP